MVRTLDFHSKNAGSNPASPNIKRSLKNSFYYSKKINHGFKIITSYVSLINPFLFSHYSYINSKNLVLQKPNEKIYVKQSYIILTWFYYINFIVTSKKKFLLKNVKLVVTPKKIKKFTLTKAPIAHKTNSKEQISIIYYNYKVFYNFLSNSMLNSYSFFSSFNETLLSVLLTKNTVSYSETNLLFLKNKKIILKILDKNFFNYNIFLKL